MAGTWGVCAWQPTTPHTPSQTLQRGPSSPRALEPQSCTPRCSSPVLGPLDGRAEGLLRVRLCTSGAGAALRACARGGGRSRLCALLASRCGCSRSSQRAHLLACCRQLSLQPRLLSRQRLRHTHTMRLLWAGDCSHVPCASRRLVGQHQVHVVLRRCTAYATLKVLDY